MNDEQLDSFAKAAFFDHMKRNGPQFAPIAGDDLWKTDAGFFAAKMRNGRESLSAEESAAFDPRIAELLPRDQVAWLLNGNG